MPEGAGGFIPLKNRPNFRPSSTDSRDPGQAQLSYQDEQSRTGYFSTPCSPFSNPCCFISGHEFTHALTRPPIIRKTKSPSPAGRAENSPGRQPWEPGRPYRKTKYAAKPRPNTGAYAIALPRTPHTRKGHHKPTWGVISFDQCFGAFALIECPVEDLGTEVRLPVRDCST